MNKATLTATAFSALLFCQSAIADTSEQASIETSSEAEAFDINVEANPFYLFFGGISAAVSFRLDKTKAIGPTVSTLSIFGSRTSTFGVQGQYHLQDKDVMSDGLMLNSSLEFLTSSIDNFFGETYRHNAVMATTSVNWQWFYDNGFNIRLGAGLAAQAGTGVGDELDYSGATGSGIIALGDNFMMHAYIDARLAWAF